jgi:hypothetical protein
VEGQRLLGMPRRGLVRRVVRDAEERTNCYSQELATNVCRVHTMRDVLSLKVFDAIPGAAVPVAQIDLTVVGCRLLTRGKRSVAALAYALSCH